MGIRKIFKSQIDRNSQIDRLEFKNSIIDRYFKGGLNSFVSVHEDYYPCVCCSQTALINRVMVYRNPWLVVP